MQTITRQATPLEEARQLRAEALADLKRLREEWPRRNGWERAMRVVHGNWVQANSMVEWPEGSR